jgi:hypothetical protein
MPRVALPPDLRTRLEGARLDSLALFRALDRLDLRAREIPQGLLRALFDLDADYAEALWVLDQPRGRFNLAAMLRDTLVALEKLPGAQAALRRQLPSRIHPRLNALESAIRTALDPREAYHDIPGRDQAG